jgi:glycerol-3-phosphate acyltransferase PlsY
MAVSRISSLSSLSAVIAAPLVAWLWGNTDAAIVLLVIAAIVTFQHRANIARLRAGTEPKIGSKA